MKSPALTAPLVASRPPLVIRAARRGPRIVVDRVKRAVKLTISCGVYAFDTVVAAISPERRRANKAAGIVLMYHDVPESRRAAFAEQCAAIARLGRPSRLDELSRPADGVWRVALTFDDGFRSYRDVALPEMSAHDIPSTLFVPTAWAHRSAREYPLDDATAVMTPDELAALPPVAEIGGHSRSHKRLSTLDDASLHAELRDAREELRDMTGRDIRYHAFPFGDHDHRVDAAARDAGFTRCYGVTPTLATDPDGFVVGRIQVEPTDGRLEFKLKVLGAYRWMGVWMSKRDRRRSTPPTGAHA